MNVNDYLARQYGPQPCWELVADVYAAELNAVPVDYTPAIRSVREMASTFRLAIHNSAHEFVQVPEPVDMCIVMLGKTERMGIHHCGIYFEGKVLHAQPGTTMFEELTVIRDAFEVVQFWAKP